MRAACASGRHGLQARLHDAGDAQHRERVRAAGRQLAALHVLQHHRVACRAATPPITNMRTTHVLASPRVMSKKERRSNVKGYTLSETWEAGNRSPNAPVAGDGSAVAGAAPVIGAVVRRWVAGTSSALTSMQPPAQRVRSAVAPGA